MSNLGEMPKDTQLRQQPNNWGVASTNIPNYQQPQQVPAKAPMQGPSQVAVLSNEGTARNKFREYNVRVQVMFAEKLARVEGAKVSHKVLSNQASDIFRPENGISTPHDIHHNAEDAAPIVDLTKGIITRIAVTSTHNEYPFPVTFDFTGQGSAANCFSLDGKQFPICLYPDENNRFNDFELYNAKDAINDPFLKRYGHVSVSDMWASIQTFKNVNWVYVPIDHDAVRLIKLNEDKFGPAPGPADVRDGIWYKMDGQRVSQAIDELYFNIISKFKFTDLTKFQVHMSRFDGRDFKDPTGSKWGHFDQVELDYKMEELLHAGCELKITWTYPQQEVVPQPAQSMVPGSQVGNVNPAVSQQYSIYNSASYQLSTAKMPVAAPKV